MTLSDFEISGFELKTSEVSKLEVSKLVATIDGLLHHSRADRAAALGEIKRAYKRLARKYHPDINPGDRMAAAHFRQISEAYETLSDPDRRRHYDTVGQPAAARGAATFGFEGFDFSVSASGVSGVDVWRSVRGFPAAGGGAPGRAAARGTDLHQTLAVSFEDAIRGGQHTLTVTRQEHCRYVSRGLDVACGRESLRSLPRRRHRQVGARAHGVLEAVRALRRVGAAAIRRAVRPAAAGRSRRGPSR